MPRYLENGQYGGTRAGARLARGLESTTSITADAQTGVGINVDGRGLRPTWWNAVAENAARVASAENPRSADMWIRTEIRTIPNVRAGLLLESVRDALLRGACPAAVASGATGTNTWANYAQWRNAGGNRRIVGRQPRPGWQPQSDAATARM